MELLLGGKLPKRVFVLFSSTGVTAPSFSEKDYTTAGGRMDVVARSAIYALWDLKDTIREDSYFIAVLNGPPDPPLTLLFEPFPVVPSETTIIKEILRGMQGLSRAVKAQRAGIFEVVQWLRRNGYKVVLLVEDGVDISKITISPGEKYAFILGDQIGFPADVVRELRRKAHFTVSLGTTSYLASHCIAFVNEWLDSLKI
ncbi:MAG: hypothetical protein ACP5IE_05375 [Infirmifilum sp.]